MLAPAGPPRDSPPAEGRSGARPALIVVAFAVATAMLAAYAIFLVQRHDWRFSPWLDGWLVVILEGLASALCLARVRGRPRHWRAALLLGSAAACWTGGDLVLTLESLGRSSSPSVSAADILYFAFFPLAGLAILSFARGELDRDAHPNWLDGAITAIGMAAICAGFAIHGLAHLLSGDSLSEITSFAYAVGDLLLLGLVAGSIVMVQRARAPLSLIAVGMAVNAAGDTFNFASSPSSAAQVVNAIAWPTALLAFAGSMWIRQRDLGRFRALPGTLLPAAVTCASLAILVLGASGDDVGVAAIALATTTILLAGLRLAFRDALIEAREQLRTSEDRYQILFERNPQPVLCATTETLEIVAVNDALLDRYGYTREELLGQDIFFLAPPEDHEMIRGYIKANPGGARGPAPGRGLPMRHIKKDGTIIDVEVTSNAVVLDGTACRLALYSDVTERNRVTRELAVARDRAVEASNMKSAFLANMSHEIRTPMNAVIGMTDLLLEERLTRRQREYAEQVSRSGEQMLALINDILDVAKLETGHVELEILEFDLRDTLARTCSIAAVQARAKGLRFELALERSVPRLVRGDGRRISQVVLNLVSNAVKFTPQGCVSVRVQAPDTDAGYHRVRVCVSDTGIGIAPAHLEQVFEPFTQADASTTRVYGGTGLGLAIVRELVGLMNGAISVESSLGKGSSFTIELELEPATAHAGESLGRRSAKPAAPRWSSPPTVLVVEDGPVNQVVALRTLERCGCRGEIARDGEEALAKLAAQPFDAVLMDCQMPGMDGYEATRELRRREDGGRRTPVIAMTAHAMRGDRDSCLEAGMDDYLTKPLRHRDLLDALARWLPASAANDSPQAPAGAQQAGRARRKAAA
jgi:PAS domain S-box-containing protein